MTVRGLVCGEPAEDRARVVDRVVAVPRPGGVGRDALGGDLDAQRALAAALDLGGRRLEEDGEVGLEEVGAGLLDEPQAVELAVDLLALVEDEGQVARGLEDLLGDLELDGHAALHVDRAATDEVVALAPGGQVRRVRGERDRVDVAGQHDPLGPPEVGAGDQRVADAGHLEVAERAQGGLDGVAQRRLVVADRLDVAQRRRQRDDVGGEVQGRQGCGDRAHARQPIQPPFPDR